MEINKTKESVTDILSHLETMQQNVIVVVTDCDASWTILKKELFAK